MGKRTIIEPITVVVNNALAEKVTTHPAFAQIAASRVSGHANLYDSDFSHQNFMTVTIRTSELHRGLNRDWHFSRDDLIEVMLSEAQWAAFVSSPNCGSGTPCTLSYIKNESIPGLPPAPDNRSLFKTEMQAMIAKIQNELNSIAEQLSGPMNKTKTQFLKDSLNTQISKLTGSTGFIADSFDEHIEHTVEKAKIEVNAYVTNLVQRTGIEALSSGSTPLLLTWEPNSVNSQNNKEV